MENVSFLTRLHHFLDRTSEIWKLALSSSVAWELAKFTGTKHPYFAPIAAILCLQVTIDKSISSAVNRIVGTIGGVFLTATIAGYLGVHAWSIGLIVLLGTAITKKAKLEEQAIYQVGISAMMVLIFQTQSHTYAFDRIMETVVGAFTAVVINILFYPPNFTEEALHYFERFSNHIKDTFNKLANWLEAGIPKGEEKAIMKEIHSMLEDLHKTLERFEQARKSLRYNIFARKSHKILEQISSDFFKLRNVYTHMASMLQALTEWSESGNIGKENLDIWENHLRTIALYIDQWKLEALTDAKDTVTSRKEKPTAISQSFPIPPEMQKYQYPITLYNHAKQLIEDLH